MPIRSALRCVALVVAALALSPAAALAQGSSVGLGVGAIWAFTTDVPPSLSVDVQVGVEVEPGLSLRLLGSIYPFEAGAPAYRVALDALVDTELTPSLVGYAGGGVGLLISPVEGLFPELHGLAGVEARVDDEIGLFAELQLVMIVPLIRVGANLQFDP